MVFLRTLFPVKGVAVILLGLTLLTPLFLKVGLVVDYLIEYEYYVMVLCKNQDKPEMKCNGTCHLAQEIKKAEEAQAPPDCPNLEEISPFVLTESDYDDIGSYLGLTEELHFVNSTYQSPFPLKISPPPKV